MVFQESSVVVTGDGTPNKPGPCNFLEEVRAQNEVRREATPCGDVWGM